MKPLTVGTVVYDPKVTIIWEIIRQFFESSGIRMDVLFYKTYELQVQAFVEKKSDLVWNSPLAWLHAQHLTNRTCRAIVMRDTDRDRVSHFVVRKGGPVRTLADLKGKVVGFGAYDSPQATMIPMTHLEEHGLHTGRDYDACRFDVLVGLHGDHIGGELDAFRALERGEVHASAMLDLNWERWSADGTIDPKVYGILATTPRFDHCVFTVRQDFPADREKQIVELLLSMSYEDPRHREMMDMEGLRAWLPGRTTGFGPLSQAVHRLDYFGGKS